MIDEIDQVTLIIKRMQNNTRLTYDELQKRLAILLKHTEKIREIYKELPRKVSKKKPLLKSKQCWIT